MARNPDSALKLGQARGAAICAAVHRGLTVTEYAAKEIKQSVVGTGGADKSQVQHMVGMLLNISTKTAGRRGRRARDRADACAHAREHRAPRHPAHGVETPPMIGRLAEHSSPKQPPWLVVDVGGVGYELEAPMSTFFDLPETGREVALFTHYAVKEDTVALYGFLREAERTLFRTLAESQRHRREDFAGGAVRRQHRRVRAPGPARRHRRADAHPRHRQEDRRTHPGRAARPRRRHRASLPGSGGAVRRIRSPRRASRCSSSATGRPKSRAWSRTSAAPGDSAEGIIRKALKAALR